MAKKETKDVKVLNAAEEVKPSLTGEIEPLEYTGSTSAKYMTAQGMCIRIFPGKSVDTPVEFVKQRLAEGCWKKVKKPVEKKEVKE